MKKKFKNSQMSLMLDKLQPLLSRRDRIGYVAARNSRLLTETLTEYTKFRNELIAKYGEDELDEHGKPTGVIKLSMQSEKFKMFDDEIKAYNEIEHEVELMPLKYEDTIGLLSGEEILAIDWMLED